MTDEIIIGKCKCGGYGQVFNAETEHEMGRCHDSLPVVKERSKCYSLISKQQLQIEDLLNEVSDFKDSISKVRLLLVCIGGPLNDNKLGYSKEQRAVFSKILDILGDDA
jgi:hypothetical protein